MIDDSQAKSPISGSRTKRSETKTSDAGQLDRTDRRILDILAVDGRLPVTDLARTVGLSKSPCQVRLRRLQDAGYIRGFRAVLDPGLLLPAFGYFIIGYLMYGAVFLAIGSLCDTLQEAQTLMSPIMLVMFIPLFVVMAAIESPDSTVVQVVSWIPIWTPFVMIARIPSDPPLWEMLATTGLMVGFAIVVIALAGAVFRQGALGRANADSVKKMLNFGKKKEA